MATFRTVLLTLAVLALGMLAGAAAMVWGGVYNVAATEQHSQPVYSLLEAAMRQSVRLRARGIETPRLDDPLLVQRGAACYRDKCQQCHGGPGVAQGDIGKSMQPLPGPLVDARRRWHARELYWVTKHGIRMSGMPAWEYRLSEQDLWAVVAFVQRMPALTPADYAGHLREAPACVAREALPAAALVPGDPRRGLRALHQYACNACHAIPGVTGSSPAVGPPLDGVGRRAMIGGRLTNTPDNMVRWLRHTHEVDPRSAMPEMGVAEQDARDIAAYLATLD